MQYEAHHRRPLRTLAAVGLATVGLVFAGCGGNDSEAQGGQVSTESAMTTTDDGGEQHRRDGRRGRGLHHARLPAESRRPGRDARRRGPVHGLRPDRRGVRSRPQETLDALAEDREMLRAVLLYHVVEGEARASDVASMRSAETLNGDSVRLRASADTVRVDAARVVKADVTASNGVIHVIDEVLIPSA